MDTKLGKDMGKAQFKPLVEAIGLEKVDTVGDTQKD